MQFQFVGKNIDVSPALKTFTTEKLKPIEKRFPRISMINVTFHIEHNDQIAEATIHIDSTEVHARAQSEDMYKTVDLLIDKLLGQLTKHKEKLIDSHR